MVFGDSSTTNTWLTDSRIEIHGPGHSKVVIGEDCIDDWEKYLDVMVASVAENGGRSCINASGIWVPSHAEQIAEAIAERLAQVMLALLTTKRRSLHLSLIRTLPLAFRS